MTLGCIAPVISAHSLSARPHHQAGPMGDSQVGFRAVSKAPDVPLGEAKRSSRDLEQWFRQFGKYLRDVEVIAERLREEGFMVNSRVFDEGHFRHGEVDVIASWSEKRNGTVSPFDDEPFWITWGPANRTTILATFDRELDWKLIEYSVTYPKK